MKCNRVNSTLTFSAALAGLALFVLTPMAHGHGNNPKETTDTEPDTNSTPPPPPKSGGGGPQIDYQEGPPLPTPDALGSIVDPGVLVGFDVTIQNTKGGLSQVVSEPAVVDIIVNPVADLTPQIATDVFDAAGAVSFSTPSSLNAIPAPGTLALLGLAAAAAGRRRRRR